MKLGEFAQVAGRMGWRKKRLSVCAWWEDAKGVDLGTVETKTSLTDAEAVSALNLLVERGCEFRLYFTAAHGFDLSVWPDRTAVVVTAEDCGTIHEAVEEAIIALIAKETPCTKQTA